MSDPHLSPPSTTPQPGRPGSGRGRRLWRYIGGLAVITGILASVVQVAGWVNWWPFGTPIGGILANGYAFTDPAPDSPNRDISGCISVHGTGTPPDGRALVLGIKQDEDSRVYYDHVQLDTARSRWAAGASTTARIGHVVTLYLMEMDAKWADYLMSTNLIDGSTWWSSSLPLPTGKAVPVMDLKRVPGKPC